MDLQESITETRACNRPVAIALWGMGTVYQESINLLLAMQKLGQIELVAVTDSAPPAISLLDGMQVVPTAELSSLDFDFLLIMNKKCSGEIEHEAIEQLGIPKQKIRTYQLLHLPGFDFRAYKRLCESRVSVLSDSCWGGFACRVLQMECLSPFINVGFRQADYLRILDNLDTYMALDEIRFIEQRTDIIGGPYFTFLLGDVEMRLFYETDPDEALANWLARREKLNYDNLFVQTSTTDPVYEAQFNALERYNRKVCFVPYETKQPHSLRIPVYDGNAFFFNSVRDTVSMEGRSVAFNLVALLLGEAEGIRYGF